MGYLPYQLVQDFFHQPYFEKMKKDEHLKRQLFGFMGTNSLEKSCGFPTTVPSTGGCRISGCHQTGGSPMSLCFPITKQTQLGLFLKVSFFQLPSAKLKYR